MRISCQLYKVNDTKIAAACIAGLSADIQHNAQIICLRGPLGVGKSELARHIITTICDVDSADIPSPTFTLVQHYQTRTSYDLWHMDLYRLTHRDEIWALGVEQGFETALCLIEWPDRIEDYLPRNRVDIQIDFSDQADDGRVMQIETDNTKWLEKLASALEKADIHFYDAE